MNTLNPALQPSAQFNTPVAGATLPMPTQNPEEHGFHSKINTSFLDFFTLSMMGIVAMVVAVVWFTRGMVVPTFMHHKELNGIILALAIYGTYRVFSNNFGLYRTALYVRSIERMEQNPAANEASITKLISGLSGAGTMLDIQNTEMALRRMLKSGFFIITDNDSRLIKSKIGSRVRYRYNHISFFAGILISFGLLGTFVGLIATVASVGEQMGTISASLSRGEQMNVIDLIAGISKPLSGMSTAFGASLFGLGGSMMLGGLNHVAGHAQDHFMENLSRWLDDRIPTVKGATADKTAEKMGVSASSITGKTMSLESGTFMVLAEDTHKQLRAIGGFMQELGTALQQQQAGNAVLLNIHQQQAMQMQRLEASIGQLPNIGQQLMQAMGAWQNTMGQQYQAQTTQLTQLHGNLSALPGAGEKITTELRELRNAYSQQLGKQTQQGDMLVAQVQNLARTLQGIVPPPGITVTAQSPDAPPAPTSSGFFGMMKK